MPDASELDYVLDSRKHGRAPSGPIMAVCNYAVCPDCAPERAREHRCPGCPMTLQQDGRLPRGATLNRY